MQVKNTYIVLTLGCVAVSSSIAEPTTFERVFGVGGTFEKQMVEKVKALPPGKRLFVDRDGDGKNDEVWFIDTAARHTNVHRPILVRVIDEDGDLDRDGPDLDSDLYLADWHADGVVDSVVDYQDNDGDNDVDEMGVYYGEYQKPWLDKDNIHVWWGLDIGDDNLLWYDVDWSYEQHGCQYRSHFGGDEVFCQFSLSKGADAWLNVFEDPFAFYDPDQDGCSEEVVRVCAVGRDIKSLRYSMDADNDAYGNHSRDYDFSITAIPGKQKIETDLNRAIPYHVRGIPTHPVLNWKTLRTYVTQLPWGKVCLTWDEMNANTEENVQRDPNRRWEGILNHKSKNFPRVGGPACSPLNKRNEVALQPTENIQLYYDSSDHRLHLKGACEGWLWVDADLNGSIDARYTYFDENKDGYFDRREVDLDADGQVDFTWKMNGFSDREFEMDFKEISSFWKAQQDISVRESQLFIDAAKNVLADEGMLPDSAETFFLNELASWMPVTGLGDRMRKTPAGARFYLDLIRDRLFLTLSKRFSEHKAWSSVAKVYEAGHYAEAAQQVAKEFGGESGNDERFYRSYTRRIAIKVDNTGKPQRDHWPVTLSVKQIQEMVPDFDPAQCAVVAPQRWIDWRELPHQVDSLCADTGRELSFLADLQPNDAATYYLYYAPTLIEETEFARKTGAAKGWIPPNIGWESSRGAYRAYGGQFDFFGKKSEQLIYDTISEKSYHSELEWGVDALHVGAQSGLGGLTLYEGTQAWPIQNPEGKGSIKFSKRIVVQGPVRSAVEIIAENIVPDQPDLQVRMICLIYAEHQESEIRVHVTGNHGEVTLAPGIMKLKHEHSFADVPAGSFGSWGWQNPKVGEIGLGLITSPDQVTDYVETPGEYRVQCLPNNNNLRYWIIGDWRRGRTYSTAPTVDNWNQEVHSLADLLLDDVNVTLGPTELISNEKVYEK